MQDNNLPDMTPRNDNVVKFQKKPKPRKPAPDYPPLINLPLATKYLTGMVVLCYVLLWALGNYIPEISIDAIYNDLGFVSAKWTGEYPFTLTALLSLITVNFLHGGWFHVIINAVTLLAFGSGIEKLIGARKMLIIFFASSAIALLTHLAVSPFSTEAVIGASGGISGLFGAILMIMKHDNRLSGNNQRILPLAILWIAITVGFGLMGAPDGSSIAWVAHIGGFVAGISIAYTMLRKV